MFFMKSIDHNKARNLFQNEEDLGLFSYALFKI